MSLRPPEGDEKRLLFNNRFPWMRRPLLCHPDPDFLPRSTGQSRVCTFPLRKGA